MKCSVKTNINAYAALSVPGTDVSKLRNALPTPAKILEDLDNHNNIIGLPNYAELVQDKKLIKKALKGIPMFSEHGLVLMPGDNRVSDATNSFMDKLMVTDEEGLSWLNSMNIDGVNMASKTPDIIQKKDGKWVSNYDIGTINEMLQKKLGDKLGEERKYIFGTKSNLRVSTALKTDYNKHRYNLYLNQMARITDSSLQDDANRPEDFNEGVRRLKSGPVISHINSRIALLQRTKKDLKGGGLKDPTAEGKLQNKILDLQAERETLKKDLDQDNMLGYFDKMLEQVSVGLRDKKSLTLEDVHKYVRGLDLIKNAATLDKTNRSLSLADMDDSVFIEAVQARSNEADILRREVDDLTVSRLKDRVEEFTGREVDDKELLNIKNLTNWFTRLTQNILGLHQIDNPIFHYINTLVDVVNSKAKSLAFGINSEIEKLYKELNSTGFPIDSFYQTYEGLSTGRMTDVFGAKWWKEKYGIMSNANKRANMTINMDPRLLFDTNASDSERKAHIAELKENLGDAEYKIQHKEAKGKYREYKQASKAAKAQRSPEAFRRWERTYSPEFRINNYRKTGKNVAKGKDTYLVVVPRKKSLNGELTGFYDDNYNKIASNPVALKLHTIIKNAHITQQIALGNYEEKFKPPTFGYVGKAASELIREGKYKEAAELEMNAVIQTYGRQNLLSKDTPLEDITGKAQPRLATELRSIPDEVRARAQKALKDNTDYQTLKGSTFPTDIARRKEIYKEAHKIASVSVNKDKSNNFLESIALSNYATISLIERQKVETEINVITNLLQDKLTTSTDSSDKQFQKAKRVALDSLTHFLNTKFYKIADQEAPMILSAAKRKKLAEARTSEERLEIMETGFTDRTAGNAMLKATRVVALGYSPINALRNLFQGGFSNLFKAIEGKYFNVKDLTQAYMDAVKPENRELLIQMDVMGDLGHQFEKKNIHETHGTLRKVGNPMTIHTMVEKTNQGAVAIAMLKNFMVTDNKTGETLSMFDAVHASENNQLSDRYSSTEFGGKKGIDLQATFVVRKIRQVNMQLHGDYFSAFNLERSTGGKQMTMFFKFFPEIFLDIWGEQRENYTEGDMKEGRFTSLTKMMKAQINGTWDDLDDVTLANKRVAITQAATVIAMFIGFAAAAKLSCDEPECKDKHGAILFGLNFMGSLSNDLFSVMNPLEPISKIANPMAATSMVTKFTSFATAFMNYIVPGGDDGLYQTDTDFNEEGDIKFVEEFKKILPIYGSTFMKSRRMSSELYRNSLLHNLVLDKAEN